MPGVYAHISKRIAAQTERMKCLISELPYNVRERGGIKCRILDQNGKVTTAEQDFGWPVSEWTSQTQLPFWLAETSLSRLPAGCFVVEADTPEGSFHEPFAVLDAEQYKAMLGALRDERLPAGSAFASTAEVLDCWRSAFRGVPDFLCIPHRGSLTVPRSLTERAVLVGSQNLISFNIDILQDPGFEPTELQRLGREAFQWATFQVSLFLYDLLFFGGSIYVSRTKPGENVGFIFYLTSTWPRVLPLDRSFPENLRLLLSSLESDGFHIRLAWKADAQHAELRLEWQRR